MGKKRTDVGQVVDQPAAVTRLLEQVCLQIVERLGATGSVLSWWDREQGVISTWIAYARNPELEPPEHANLGGRYRLQDYPATARVLQEGVTLAVQVNDSQADPAERAFLELAGQQALLMLPVMAGGEVIGLLEIFQRDRPRVFSPEEIDLARALAEQASIVLENVHLFHERDRRVTELSIITEIGQALSLALELEELLELVHRQVSRVFDTTNFYIATYREGSDEWMMAFQVERSERQPPGPRQLAAGLTGHIIRSHQPILLHSVEDCRVFHEGLGISMLGEQAWSWLGVPLVSAEKLVGVMAVQSYREEGLYNEDDLALFSTIAGQVASALDNLQLLEETRRRAREMEVINEVGQALTSVLDLDELLRQIVDITKSRFGHYFVSIALVEGDQVVFREGSTIGDSDLRMERGHVAVDLEGVGLIAEAARTGRPVLVHDVLIAPQYLPVAELPDTRSELVVPVRFEDRVTGVLDVQSDRSHAYDQADVALVQALANQAGVAIENARSFEEREQRITELAILGEIGRALSSALDLEDLLEVVHRQVSRVFDTTNFYIATYEEEVDEWILDFHLERGERQPVIRHEVEAGLTGYIIRNRQPVLLRDSEETRLFHEGLGISLIGEQALSWLGVPLISADKLVGVMAVQSYEKEGLYGERELALFSTIAAQAAVAIENARLYSRVQEQLEELRRASETQFRLLEQVREMSTPVIPLHNRIMLLPLIGVLDSDRARLFTERLLEAVRQQRAQVVLLDITGVPLVDTAVAQALLQSAEATRLLGAEVVLVGVRSEVAQTLVTLGLDMEGLVTRANLQAGIEYALSQVGREIVAKRELEPERVGRPPSRRI